MEITGQYLEMRGRNLHIAAIRDITQRVRVEEALRQSEERFRQLAENIQEVFWLKRVDTNEIMYVSPAYKQVWGRTAESLYADPTSWSDAICPEDRDRVVRAVSDRLGEDAYDEEYRIVRPDGTERWIRDRGFPIRDEHGVVQRIAGIAEDITQRKHAEETARRLAAIVESSGDAIIGEDLDGIVTTWNQGAEKLYGYEASEAIGRRLTALIEGQGEKEIEALNEHIRRGKPVRRLETVQQRKDGSAVDVSLTISPIRSPAGETVGASIIARDITPRRQAERALRTSEEKYRLLFDSARDHIFVHELNPDGSPGRFIEVNKAACERLGYSRDELLGMTPADIDGPSRNEDRERALHQLHANGYAVFEMSHVAKDGTEIPLELSSHTFLLGGRPTVLTIARDISERKEAEEALRRSELFSSMLLRESPNPIVAIGLDGAVRYVNPALERLTGFRAEELVGQKPPYPWWPPELEGKMHRDFNRALRQGTRAFEERFQTKDGKPIWVEVTSLPVSEADGRGFYLASWVDITEKRLGEERLQQLRADLAHAYRVGLMGQMASQIAHEMNQPLMAISAYTEACKRLVRLRDLESLEATLDKTAQQGQRAAQIVRRIRQFVRKREPDVSRLQINDAIREAVALAEPEARRNRIDIVLELDDALSPVLADPVQVQQVVLNLVRNSIEAIDESANGARKVTVRSRSTDSRGVLISVEDTGAGLAEDSSERIFDTYYTTKQSGMGMGLSICRSIAEAHGGRIWAVANPEGGATFHLLLPEAAGDQS